MGDSVDSAGRSPLVLPQILVLPGKEELVVGFVDSCGRSGRVVEVERTV